MDKITYSNPRLSATIENWPLGSNKRGPAHFAIEAYKGQERAVRTTTGKPKKRTYANKARIVDGSDGKTYIAEFTNYGFIAIKSGDMQHDHENFFEENPRYAEMLALFA